MHDQTDTPQVTASCNHAQVSAVKLDVVGDATSCDVNLDRVVDLDEGIRVPDGTGIVGAQVGDTLGASPDIAHLAQLVLGFIVADAVHCKATLDVVDQAEVLRGLID